MKRTVPLDRLRELHSQGLTVRQISIELGFWKSNITKNLVKLGLKPHDCGRRPWTEQERARLRLVWPDVVAKKKQARDLLPEFPGKTVARLYQQAKRLGITGPHRIERPKNWKSIIRAKLKLGWADSEIAAVFKVDRRTITDWRHELGLKASGHSDHYRKRVAETTKQQLKKAGLRSLAELRGKAFEGFAEQHGWPRELRPRAVQIIELLMIEQAMTRREICSRLDLRWANTRSNGLHSNVKGGGGSYLGNLMRAGLVICSSRLQLDANPHKACKVYSPSPLAYQMKAAFHSRSESNVEKNTQPGIRNFRNDGRESTRRTVAGARPKRTRR